MHKRRLLRFCVNLDSHDDVCERDLREGSVLHLLTEELSDAGLVSFLLQLDDGHQMPRDTQEGPHLV